MVTTKIMELDKSIDLLVNIFEEMYIAGLVEDIFEGNLTEAQMKCLLFVIRNQEISSYRKIRISDVSDALHISLPAATKAIARLLEKDLIKKVRDREDNRNILITPTTKGVKLAKEYSNARLKLVSELADRYTNEDFDRVLDTSKQFIENNIAVMNKAQLLKICRRCGSEHQELCLIKKRFDVLNKRDV